MVGVKCGTDLSQQLVDVLAVRAGLGRQHSVVVHARHARNLQEIYPVENYYPCMTSGGYAILILHCRGRNCEHIFETELKLGAIIYLVSRLQWINSYYNLVR